MFAKHYKVCGFESHPRKRWRNGRRVSLWWTYFKLHTAGNPYAFGQRLRSRCQRWFTFMFSLTFSCCPCQMVRLSFPIKTTNHVSQMTHNLEDAIIVDGVVYELTPVADGCRDCESCDLLNILCDDTLCVDVFGFEKAQHCNFKRIF